MGTLSRFVSRIRALFQRRRLEQDLEDELAFHLAMRAGQMASDDAARRRFGNVTRITEQCRELWTFPAIESLWRDVRYGLRGLRRTPSFTIVAVASLGLGIGANAALFSLMDVMLLRHLPVRDAARLVEFARISPPSKMTNQPEAVFDYLRRDHSVLSDVFAVRRADAAVQAGGAGESAEAHLVSGSFFPALGVNAQLGRILSSSDDNVAARAAVLSYGYWTRRFGSDPGVVGRVVRVNGAPLVVVGVMPREFFGFDRAHVPDLWMPLSSEPELHANLWVLGHLRPGVSIAQAEAALSPLFRAALDDNAGDMTAWPEADRRKYFAQTLLVQSAAAGPATLRWTYWERMGVLKILVALSGLILLIMCVNLASLLMARAGERTREMGVRLALGAGRARLLRQLLTESLLVATAGGVVGVALANWGHDALLDLLVTDARTMALDFRLDARLLGFAVAVSVVACLLFGLAPAVWATRTDLSRAMHGAAHRRDGIPAARLLVAAQVAFSMVLLAAAALSTRSLWNLGSTDLGLARKDLLLMNVHAGANAPQLWRSLETQAPTVALAGAAIFGNGGWSQTVWVDQPGKAPVHAQVGFNSVSPGFFAAVGIPVLLGREFQAADHAGAPEVVIVNQTFARRYLGSASPLGQRCGDDGRESSAHYQIVGVVPDAKVSRVRDAVPPMVFHALAQMDARESLVVHAHGSADELRRAIAAADPDAVVSDVRTLPEIVHRQLREDRMIASLAVFFALLAVTLGAIGIYGVVACQVTARWPEFGVRVALGAAPRDVVGLVVRQTFRLACAGALVGVVGAFAAMRLLRSLLYELSPADPLSFAAALLILLGTGALAGYLPARRAAAVDPALALRAE